MPHSSRKNGKAHDRRRNVQGVDGWTHVKRGPPARSASLDSSTDGARDLHQPRPGLTLGQIQEHSVRIAEKWKDTAMFEKVQRVFEEHILKLENIRITSCVCLGLGNLTTDIGRPDICLIQLAALESMLELLSMSLLPSHNIEC